jgi:selenocysteine-specific elongation factor
VHVVATAGHVDHGKSTLIRALTGMEPDRWAEERRRGMTIDLGFAWTTLPGGSTIAFVDVPGHERFITSMLAGVGPVPAVLFVVAADSGWMPQSAEHLDALAALGVAHGVVAVTRSDLMDAALAAEEAREHLAGTPLAGLPTVAVSATTGAGMDELRAALDRLAGELPEANPAADVRLWIDRAFTIRGAGTVVTGTLGAGTIGVDDKLDLVGSTGPGQVSVRALQCLGEPVERAHGVCRVAVNLRRVALSEIVRGDALVTPGAWLAAGVVDVRLHPCGPPTAGGAQAVPSRLPAQLSLHVGSAARTVRLRMLGPDAARLRIEPALPLRIGERAVLRDPGRRAIVAGVTVLDVQPPALRRRGAAALRAVELAGMSDAPTPAAELARRGVAPRAALVAMGVPGAASWTGAPELDGWLIDAAWAATLAARLAEEVRAHDCAGVERGLALDAARRALQLPSRRLVAAVLDIAAGQGYDAGLIVRDGRVEQQTAPALAPRLQAALNALRADLERNQFAAPDAAQLAALGLGARELAALTKAGELLWVADGIVLLPGADELAVAALRTVCPEFTMSAARQALGTSRRVAVPLLDLLARTGRAERTADGTHRLLP